MNTDADRLELTRRLHALEIDYWHDVDTNWGRNAPDYFTVDARWIGDRTTFEGREAIRDFYTWRENRGGRVVFHSVQNFSATFDGTPDKARVDWTMVLFGGDGTAPLPPAPPILIDNKTERWACTDDGWKITERRSHVLFKGGQLLPKPADGYA